MELEKRQGRSHREYKEAEGSDLPDQHVAGVIGFCIIINVGSRYNIDEITIGGPEISLVVFSMSCYGIEDVGYGSSMKSFDTNHHGILHLACNGYRKHIALEDTTSFTHEACTPSVTQAPFSATQVPHTLLLLIRLTAIFMSSRTRRSWTKETMHARAEI